MPFLRFSKPLWQSLTLAKRSIKTIRLGARLHASDQESYPTLLLQTSFATVVLVLTLLGHPLRKFLINGQTVTTKCFKLYVYPKIAEQDDLTKEYIPIVKSVLELGIFFTGSYQLNIASFFFKVITRLYSSHSQYQESLYPESVKHLATATVKVAKQILKR